MEHHHQPMRSIDFPRTGGLNFSKTDMTEVLKPWIIINLRSIDFPRTGGLNFSKTEKSDTGWHPTCIMVSLPPNLVQRNQMNIFLGQQVALATAINFLGTQKRKVLVPQQTLQISKTSTNRHSDHIIKCWILPRVSTISNRIITFESSASHLISLLRRNNGNAEKTDNNLTNIRENTKRPITIFFYKNMGVMGVSHSEYAILCACLQK